MRPIELNEGRDPARLKVRMVITFPDGRKFTERAEAVALHDVLWPQDAGQLMKDVNVAVVTRILNNDPDQA